MALGHFSDGRTLSLTDGETDKNDLTKLTPPDTIKTTADESCGCIMFPYTADFAHDIENIKNIHTADYERTSRVQISFPLFNYFGKKNLRRETTRGGNTALADG